MSPIINPTLPSPGSPRGTEETDVRNALTALLNLVNGDLDVNNMDPAAGFTADQLAAAVASALGLSQTGVVRRGKSIIATEESRTNVAYGLLTTPDRVQNIVMPTDGILRIGYHATWKESVDGAGRAAIFIGANQLKIANGSDAAPAVTNAEAGISAGADTFKVLGTHARGLVSDGTTATIYTGDVTTGQIVGIARSTFAVGGGFCEIFVAAGTYDISVQFKSSSGSVTVKNRKLWVSTIGF